MLKEFCYDWLGYNQQIFSTVNLWLNNHQIDGILQNIATPFFVGYFAIIYCSLSALTLCTIRKHGSEDLFNESYDKLLHIGCSYALFGFVYAGLKFGINLPRPYCSLQAHQFFSSIALDNERCLSSFPSAHTGMAVFMTYFLWPYASKFLRIIMGVIIILVASSRIASAMHYPADIIYGALLAIIVIKATAAILRNRNIQSISNIIKKWIGTQLLKA